MVAMLWSAVLHAALHSTQPLQPLQLAPNVRDGATTAMAIRAMVIVMVLVVGIPIPGPMPWMPMSSQGK